MAPYRVKLDIYNGPLDLLLYLIRRDEVDVYDIPIARITEQYMSYVEMLKGLDPNLVGEFLVMAATLLEIKTRTLLPSPPATEEGEAGANIDPRAELVRQLLEYKAFKDAAGELKLAAEEQALRYPRSPGDDDSQEDLVDLEEAQVWDLLEAFNRLMEAIGHRPTHHEVIYDETPVELHAADILDRISQEGPMSFQMIFEGRTARVEIVGLFLALLELVRQKKLQVRQDRNFGQIQVVVNPDPPEEEAADASVPAAPAGENGEPGPSPDEDARPARPPKDLGQYVSHTRGDGRADHDDDDAGGAETTGV